MRGIAALVAKAFDGVEVSHSWVADLLGRAGRAARDVLAAHFRPLAHDVDLDEIFLAGKPLLLVVEPRSHAIHWGVLAEDRSLQAWKAALDGMNLLERVTADRGTSIVAVCRELGLLRQSDLFHAVREVGRAVRAAEAAAYRQLSAYYDAEESYLKKRQSDPSDLRPAAQRLRRFREETDALIECFDRLEAEARRFREAFEFTRSSGCFQSARYARQLAGYLVARLREARPTGFRRAIKAIEDPRLYYYLEELEAAIAAAPLGSAHGKERSRIAASAFHLWRDVRSAQAARGAKDLAVEPQLGLRTVAFRLLVARLGGDPACALEALFAAFDRVHRSSSAVECVNGRLRLFQRTRHHLGKDFFFLLALYHNITPFRGGKRAGQSPADILGVRLPTTDLASLLALV